ncbi:MAG: methylmalonyl Co-A mutase-associated GTPase MeaB [Acidimicrobiia bacterium]
MTEPAAADEAAVLADRAAQGDRGALARVLSLVERGGDDAHVALTALGAGTARARVVGITGAPGAGKSTLTAALVGELRGAGARVAVLAVDPSSPFSGGAILGDRIRMQEHEGDPEVYLRSMASRSHLGGLARATPQAVRVLDRAGFDPVLVETVGVGQSEVAVAATADTTVIVVNPGWGDAVQAAKAGLLEVGDVFVVNKADRPGATDAVRDLESVLGPVRSGGWRPPVLTTVATEGRGIDGLAGALADHWAYLHDSGEVTNRRERRVRSEVRGMVLEALAARAEGICEGPRFDSVVSQVASGSLDPYTAARDLLGSDR